MFLKYAKIGMPCREPPPTARSSEEASRAATHAVWEIATLTGLVVTRVAHSPWKRSGPWL
jgi:hypothetical protein